MLRSARRARRCPPTTNSRNTALLTLQDDFEKLREVRKRKMIQKQKKTQKNVLNGHGRYMELSDQKEFFEACRVSEQVTRHASALRPLTSVGNTPRQGVRRPRRHATPPLPFCPPRPSLTTTFSPPPPGCDPLLPALDPPVSDRGPPHRDPGGGSPRDALPQNQCREVSVPCGEAAHYHAADHPLREGAFCCCVVEDVV